MNACEYVGAKWEELDFEYDLDLSMLGNGDVYVHQNGSVIQLNVNPAGERPNRVYMKGWMSRRAYEAGEIPAPGLGGPNSIPWFYDVPIELPPPGQPKEEEIVQYLTQKLVDDVTVSEYISQVQQEAGQFWYDDEPVTELQESAYYAERANILFRLLGLVTAQLYHHGVE